MKILVAIAFYALNIFDVHAMSKEEAVHRCQVRLNDLGHQVAGVTPTEHRTVVQQGIQDTKKIISQLEQSADSSELYRLSSACHDALFALEWIVHQYGTKIPASKPLTENEKNDTSMLEPTNIAFKKVNSTNKTQATAPRKMVKLAKVKAKISKKKKVSKKNLTSNKKTSHIKAKKKVKRIKAKKSLKTA